MKASLMFPHSIKLYRVPVLHDRFSCKRLVQASFWKIRFHFQRNVKKDIFFIFNKCKTHLSPILQSKIRSSIKITTWHSSHDHITHFRFKNEVLVSNNMKIQANDNFSTLFSNTLEEGCSMFKYRCRKAIKIADFSNASPEIPSEEDLCSLMYIFIFDYNSTHDFPMIRLVLRL